MNLVRYILSPILILLLGACTTSKKTPSPDFNCALSQEPLKDFRIDIFGNIYTIDLSNRLKVYDSELTFLFEYYNNGLGDISHIDVTNSKKISIFFDGFQKIVIIDDTLAELGRYEGDYNILAMGTSRDNNVWIYDGLDYRLKKISGKNEVLEESNPLESHHRLDILPNYIVEYDNMVYLVEEEKGIAIFDNFGTFSEYLPLEASSYSFANGSMYYMKQGSFFKRTLGNVFSSEVDILSLSEKTSSVYLSNKDIYYLLDQCLMRSPGN